MKSLQKVLALVAFLVPMTALASLPYPEYDVMPRPQVPDYGWNANVMPGLPRYDHERLSPDCQVPPGMYRYVLIKGQDYYTDQEIRKVVLKIHVNEGGMAVATLEVQPDRSAVNLQRLLGDEPRREMYVINSYRTVADLRRCSGYGIQLDADRVRLFDKSLSGTMNGYYEPGRGSIRVNGELFRKKVSGILFGDSEMRIRLDSVRLKRTGDH
ncbi:hypothetical protein M3P05_03460 [Sansalvadorimonas sp. 2012CJ34-2]|uniref:Uncharacterized protein n=1 Tax=Parendozoicomonas callyspongiae TaxID=2942213 RepID=A0ABT0PC97_9GAMM|nr:hypothetical protein [Sansalvadorimonas sp. 2012CJ34-2]MCL6268999.1 hypothetical protein [Sansalvadorimonas sp. 2012CJ34-2]